MKHLYVLALAALASCTQLGQKIASSHPNSVMRTPQSIPEAVGQAVEVKRTVDDYSTQKQQQTQQAKEEKYAAIQERQRLQADNAQLKQANQTLRAETTKLKTDLEAALRDNGNLNTRITLLNGQVDNLKSNETLLRQTLQLLTQRQSSPPVQPAQAASLGETNDTDNASAYQRETATRTRSSSVTTYTPRAAPVRRAQQVYHLGPRGGCYYLTGSGRKEYVDRSLCH